MQTENTQLNALVDAMTGFASNTRNDLLSVEVARVAHRLQHLEDLKTRPLTRREHAVIRPFLAKLAAA